MYELIADCFNAGRQKFYLTSCKLMFMILALQSFGFNVNIVSAACILLFYLEKVYGRRNLQKWSQVFDPTAFLNMEDCKGMPALVLASGGQGVLSTFLVARVDLTLGVVSTYPSSAIQGELSLIILLLMVCVAYYKDRVKS